MLGSWVVQFPIGIETNWMTVANFRIRNWVKKLGHQPCTSDNAAEVAVEVVCRSHIALTLPSRLRLALMHYRSLMMSSLK